MKKLSLLFFAIILLSGCALYEQDSYQENYVVESYLVAGDELPKVRLSTTSPISKKYKFEDNTVSNANVEVRRLTPDSSVAETYAYLEQESGIYKPQNSITVQDHQLYGLHITTDKGDEITATTFVPGNFKTVNELQEEYMYQGSQQIEVITTPSQYLTNRQAYYIFTVNAVNPDTASLTPFYMDQVLNGDSEIEDFYINSSGIINEKNYDRNENNNIQLTVPWLAIAFYDTNNVVANAIDNNMYDFLRSQDVQTGGSTLSPGEIQNINYNISGGIGIFGSMASDTNQVVISKPDQSNGS
ncbi:DUF4249 family protein [Fodinibius halophilus]|uniref:DUF4249 family protein n=1 Tax=Fodinibius halophilus TaxID=1736908 RepID=A0A6M1T5E1_9BACT|nr:DUF4249 family protein [Fodinibius halophilus]NGP87853.1 DUF4249 family protein [Fodinibius halophilus]